MGYICDRCNLKFTDFEQYLDDECKSHNATQMTDNEARKLENFFYRFKNVTESHISNNPKNEENNKFLMTDTALEAENMDFVYNYYRAN
ncbi:hypothetical protein TNCV_1376711 [Trichonephila clavipes]|nr:hypothetical protein TNCV_1376711 [Trichonephila clavipes]